MKRKMHYLAIVLFVVGVLAIPTMAQEQPRTKEQEEKDTLIANIVALRNQETKVAVLQQILNEQLMALRQMQAVFCDQYKLDPDKFRQGFYSYDEQQSKFVEKGPAAEKPAAQTPEAKLIETKPAATKKVRN